MTNITRELSVCPKHGCAIGVDDVCASCKYSTATASATAAAASKPLAAKVDARIFTAEEEAKIRHAVLTDDQRARTVQYRRRDAETVAQAAATRRRNKLVNRGLAAYAALTAVVVVMILAADAHKREQKESAAVRPSINYAAQCTATMGGLSQSASEDYVRWLGYDPCDRHAARTNATMEAAKARAASVAK